MSRRSRQNPILMIFHRTINEGQSFDHFLEPVRVQANLQRVPTNPDLCLVQEGGEISYKMLYNSLELAASSVPGGCTGPFRLSPDARLFCLLENYRFITRLNNS